MSLFIHVRLSRLSRSCLCWVRIVSDGGEHQPVTPSVRDRLSFEKAKCPLLQLSDERRSTGTNREVIEFFCFISTFLSPSFWQTNCVNYLGMQRQCTEAESH